MTLGSTQPLREMSTRDIYLQVPTVQKSGSLSLLEPNGPLQGLLFTPVVQIAIMGLAIRYSWIRACLSASVV